MFSLYGTPGPGLGPIQAETDSVTSSAAEDSLFDVPNVVFKATSHAYREYQNALGKHIRCSRDSPSSARKPTTHPTHGSMDQF